MFQKDFVRMSITSYKEDELDKLFFFLLI